jgi:glycerol-3-phosphate acyltransferase PlsY
MSFVLLILIAALPAYIFGSVNGAIITTRLFYRKDIREFGSGNPGLTNFFRVFGKGGIPLVIFTDVFKTIAPVAFGGWLFATFSDMELSQTWLFGGLFEVSIFGILLSGLFVQLGHCFPLFYKFKGGKGVMAIGIIVIMLDWRLALMAWGVFVLIVLLTRFVSLGSMFGSATVPFLQFLVLGLGGYFELVVATLCAVLVIARHSANIRKLIKGEESKLSFSRKKDKELKSKG